MKKAFTFIPGLRPDKPDLQPKNPGSSLTKRREQLRKAQRTHRQRKDKYFKELESEVLRLRTSEVALTIQVQELQNRVEALQNTLERQTPSSSCIPHHEPNGFGDYDNSTNLDFRDIQLPMRLCSQDMHIEKFTTPPAETNNQAIELDNHQMTPTFTPAASTSLVPSPAPNDRSQSMDMIDAGMEFVLALEHPCRPHLEFHADKPNGHCLLASSILIDPRRQHTQRIAENSASLDKNVTAIFARLLVLSQEFVLDHEISPTQAWCCILQQPWAHRLDGNQLKRMRVLLMETIKCYGYGAVMRRDVFNDVLFRIAADLM